MTLRPLYCAPCQYTFVECVCWLFCRCYSFYLCLYRNTVEDFVMNLHRGAVAAMATVSAARPAKAFLAADQRAMAKDANTTAPDGASLTARRAHMKADKLTHACTQKLTLMHTHTHLTTFPQAHAHGVLVGTVLDRYRAVRIDDDDGKQWTPSPILFNTSWKKSKRRCMGISEGSQKEIY